MNGCIAALSEFDYTPQESNGRNAGGIGNADKWRRAYDIRRIYKQKGLTDKNNPTNVARVTDISVLSGVAMTEEVVKEESNKSKFISVIKRFASDNFSEGSEFSGISQQTLDASLKLFGHVLKIAPVLPKITPDEEGSLLAVWENAEKPILLIVDNWKLHLITSATTPDARYYEDMGFDGEVVPEVIVEAVRNVK